MAAGLGVSWGCFFIWIWEYLLLKFKLSLQYINLLAYSAIYTFFWLVAAILLAFHIGIWTGNAGASVSCIPSSIMAFNETKSVTETKGSIIDEIA